MQKQEAQEKRIEDYYHHPEEIKAAPVAVHVYTREPEQAAVYQAPVFTREPEAREPEQKPVFSLNQDYDPVYQTINNKDYVRSHPLTDGEAFIVDRAVNMAQSGPWNEGMLSNSNYNDYIQGVPKDYPAPRTSIIDLPPDTWMRYQFKDERAP